MKKKTDCIKGKYRLELIDGIRGLAIINMICFHACFILNVFSMGISDEMLYGVSFTVWERYICCSFIFISGYAFNLSKNNFKNGLRILGIGIMITLVTVCFVYEIRIVFGVLCMLGFSQLLMIPIDRLISKYSLEKSKMIILLIIALLLMLFTWNINKGYLGLTGKITLPYSLYDKGYFMTFIGFMDKDFYSTDYFSLFPWFFLYFVGYATGKLLKNSKFEREILTIKVPILSNIGKHALVIYIVHPIILFAGVYLIYYCRSIL